MTQKYKVLVTRKWPKKVEEELQLNYEATLNESDTPLSEKELTEAMQNHDALLPTVTDKISDAILSTENKKVKIVGNFGEECQTLSELMKKYIPSSFIVCHNDHIVRETAINNA